LLIKGHGVAHAMSRRMKGAAVRQVDTLCIRSGK
jgi:hypothetical protein